MRGETGLNATRMSRRWSSPEDQARDRPLSATLACARAAAARSGVTRLADVTELGGMGVPTFQAVRPWSRSLSVSQGKGLTPMAAMASALLEAVEIAAAERLGRPTEPAAPLASRCAADVATWAGSPRDPLGIRLDPTWSRHWVKGVDLATGRAAAIPWDLLCLDFTLPRPPDIVPSSVGLATGNSRAEALVAALAELVEHHLKCRFHQRSPRERRAVELDLTSVDVPPIRRVLARMERRGAAVRAWSIGQDAGAPAFRCSIFPASGRSETLGPISGNGCHPSRRIGLLRALLEAAQCRATLVAGARDDLDLAPYRDGERDQLDLILSTLSFGPGPLAWADVPDRAGVDAEANAAVLLDAIGALTRLPVLAFDHDAPHPALHVVHAVAPGLADVVRARLDHPIARPAFLAPVIRGRASSRVVIFAGPSLAGEAVPGGVERRGPALCGDLAALLDDPPSAVGLIDGCFELAPTVWHKEVLELIAAGVRVAGGASLGAIRAAELASLGMEGVGAVFTGYASGAIRRDDAVMLDHAPAELDHRALTLSLVDAEVALLSVSLSARDRRMLQRIVRTVHYTERTWACCLRLFAQRTGRAPPVAEAALAAVPSLKRRDARAVVAALLEPRAALHRPPPPRTIFHQRLLATRRCSARPSTLPA